MKSFLTFIYIISFLFSSFLFSQSPKKDSISRTLGVRLGGDLSNFVKTAVIKDYSAYEINAELLLSKRFSLAGEFGSETRSFNLPNIDFSTKGSYMKFGVDYNMYENWLNMQNSIYAGLRYGFSSYSLGITDYELYNSNNYWNEDLSIASSQDFESLSSAWVELVMGVKVEVLKNVFLGINFQLKSRLSDKTPEGYPALYVPGFGKTNPDSKFGAGFGYTLSYLIPIKLK